MVRDGYYYALPLIAAGILLGWLTQTRVGDHSVPAGIFLLVVFPRS